MKLLIHLSFTKIRLLKLKTVPRILIILLGINSSASAQSLNEYCLSTVGQIETTTKTKERNLTPQLPSFIDSVETLPELYEKPCNKFYRFFWGSCDHKTFFSYRPTLNRAFIQDHRQTDWEGHFVHYGNRKEFSYGELSVLFLSYVVSLSELMRRMKLKACSVLVTAKKGCLLIPGNQSNILLNNPL